MFLNVFNKINNYPFINKLIFLNGIYDILCGFSILKLIDISLLSKLHLNMFINKFSDQEKRLLAYWIITYGLIRLFGSLNYFILVKFLVSITYIIEAVVMYNECFIHKTIDKNDSIIIIIISIIMGLLILY
jgi:hypothetical protein